MADAAHGNTNAKDPSKINSDTGDFVHLHVHSHYSLLEACGTTKHIAKKTEALGMSAVALTDHGNLFGAPEFYFACKDANVKPILGFDAFLAPKGRKVRGEDREALMMPNRRLVLLAENIQGYRNLCKLSSIGYQEGFYYKPRIDEEVIALHSANLIALSGGRNGIIACAFRDQGAEKALETVRRFAALFPERFYLELVRGFREGKPTREEKALEDFLLEASRITGVPTVAANDVHYIERDDAIAQDVLVCIGTNKTLNDESRHKLGSDEFYFKSPAHMHKLFADVPGACARTVEIADRCKVSFKLKDDAGKPIYHLPTFPTGPGLTLKEEMRRIALEGLAARFAEADGRQETVPESEKPEYLKRLDFEIDVIDGMGFVGYFMIVQDFINWAKTQGIPVGPGRGSGAGSLVSYCLRITDLDPISNKLLFERFLNPERISMPDFDIDFCQDRRHEVIEYVTRRYGAECVSQIITFGKLQAKAAVRDVGRTLGMTFGEVDVIAKLIPEKLGINLKDSLEQEPRLREMMEEDPKINNLLNLALKIEGLCRHASIHAAGVIISDKPLVEHAPLYKAEDGANVVQFDMKMAEKIGLIKFDFLGLKTLTLIDDALKMIELNRGIKIAVADISLKDPNIYRLMSRGDTDGIFQFEGDGITDLIMKVRPDSFEDITAINALYRPGPMQMLEEYTGRKQGRIKVSYIFPELEDILKETYGILVYQEQVMQTASAIAGYSLGEADMLRRAMGKKIAAEMAQQRTRFMEGAAANGHNKAKAEELFDLMARFAEYGFNKSHAAAYCVVAAQTAWLKAYYLPEFYAAMLSTEMGDTDKIVRYVKDAREHKIAVRPPHINYSSFKFTVKGEEVFFSLGAIKGVGEAAVHAIIEARASRPSGTFETLQDFFETVDLRRINKKVIECLIKAGALDGYGFHRAQLLNGYAHAVEWAERSRNEREVGQTSLFALHEDVQEKLEFPNVGKWRRLEHLEHEKDVLGFYLSGHPLDGIESLMKPFINATIGALSGVQHKQERTLAGLVATFREIITKKGTRMAFVGLEDLTGSVELVVFPDLYAKVEMTLKSESPLLVTAIVEQSESGPKLIAQTIMRLEDQALKSNRLTLTLSSVDEDLVLDKLSECLHRHSGTVSVNLRLQVPHDVTLQIKNPAGIKPTREFFDDLYTVLGRADFELA